MARWIDAELLAKSYLDVAKEEHLTGLIFISPEDVANTILRLSEEFENVAPVIHAHWVRWKEPKVTNPVYRCSNCDFDITVDKHPNVGIGFWIDDFRYCLCCGAKMDEQEVK